MICAGGGAEGRHGKATLAQAGSTGTDIERLYDAEAARVAQAAYAVCGDRLAASEVAQEAFAVALASWPRVASTDDPGLWVRRVGINLALRARSPGDHAEPDGPPLARAVRGLPTPQRLALVLRHVHGLSGAEVAATMGLREETVGVHLGRAHRAVVPEVDDPEAGPAIARALRDELQAVADLVPTQLETQAWTRPTLLFVTSPALGPSTLAPTVDAVARLGHAVGLVDLSDLSDLPPPRWRSAAGRIAAAVYAARGPVVLVGHGQAGPLLVPAADLRRVAGVILLDTALPPLSGEVPALQPALVHRLAAQVVDGRLPPWETWWPQCALEFLVDDPELRARIRAELPAIPASYGDEEVPVGPRWRTVPAGYLRLSLVRESEATFAGLRGMAVERLSADHLATATQPEAVAARLAALMEALEPAMI